MQKKRKRLERLKKPKPKTISKKPTSLAQERTQMMNFLKGQGYKNLKKLRYPQMKELYDKVQESIKDSFKDFIPMDSEKEKQMLQERDAKRLLRKRKATATKTPSKKLKLRTATIDSLEILIDCNTLRRVHKIDMLMTSEESEDWGNCKMETNESFRSTYIRIEDGTNGWGFICDGEEDILYQEELMIRMLDHGMEVEDESDIAIWGFRCLE
ncbi:hypothetical protein Tco_1376147 [Tanacetum coccineum]